MTKHKAMEQPQTPDDLLRQSEREGWRYAKELEGEVLRLNKENVRLREEIACEERRFNELFDDYNRLVGRLYRANIRAWIILIVCSSLWLGLLIYGVAD